MKKRNRNKGELAIVVMCAVLGFLLAIQLKSVKLNAVSDTTNAGRLETLQGLYNAAVDKTDTLEKQLAESQAELAAYRSEAASDGGVNEVLGAEIEKLEILAGLVDVEGPGVMVVMRDSIAVNATGNEANYLLHDSDLLSVINELRDAGAEAISLNGERLLATSEVRCTGAVVSVNGRRYAAPFVLYAIGDATTLYNALTMRNGVVDILGQWKIEVRVTLSEKLLIPKYNGMVELRYTRPATEVNAGEEAVG